MKSVSAWRIGLTGGIGSGKSTVAKVFVDRGAALIDADAISHRVTAPGGVAIPAIVGQFGPSVISPSGAMNRDVMRALVFGNPEARHQLEAIIHPVVGAEINRQAEAAISEGAQAIVFDVPLLVESMRWRPMLDVVIVVDCDESTQQERVLSRQAVRPPASSVPGWTAETVREVIRRQASRQTRAAAADMCIFNDGLSLVELRLAVLQMASRFGL